LPAKPDATIAMIITLAADAYYWLPLPGARGSATVSLLKLMCPMRIFVIKVL
jgi:hypothetical protein